MDAKADFPAFGLSDVFFSFVAVLLMMTFGMYGLMSLNLPYDDPYCTPRQSAAAPAPNHWCRERRRGRHR